ncbi:MAG: LysR family transcriptional regulator [Pseudonocardiaceae bacterium]
MSSAVELREIRTFLALAEELHFGRTADRLGLTPSRVSQTIRTLESRIGGRLFERTSRHVRLTPAGEQLRLSASSAYQALEQAIAVAQETVTGVSGALRLGMYSTCNGGTHLVEIVKTFEARYPACSVVVTNTGFARDQLDWLRHGELDLLAMRLPLHDPTVTIGPILSAEPRVLAVATDHPLAGRESVCIEDLADYTLSDVPTLPREVMDAFIPPRTPSGKRLRRTETHAVAETPVRVALGEIVHPTVPSFLDHYPHPGVISIPIRDMPPSRTALVWLSHTRSAKTRAFARTAHDVLVVHEDTQLERTSEHVRP